MSTHDNAPPPADWYPSTGYRCGGCGASGNLCHCLTQVDEQPCCGRCTHPTTAGSKQPLVWMGDDG